MKSMFIIERDGISMENHIKIGQTKIIYEGKEIVMTVTIPIDYRQFPLYFLYGFECNSKMFPPMDVVKKSISRDQPLEEFKNDDELLCRTALYEFMEKEKDVDKEKIIKKICSDPRIGKDISNLEDQIGDYIDHIGDSLFYLRYVDLLGKEILHDQDIQKHMLHDINKKKGIHFFYNISGAPSTWEMVLKFDKSISIRRHYGITDLMVSDTFFDEAIEEYQAGPNELNKEEIYMLRDNWHQFQDYLIEYWLQLNEFYTSNSSNNKIRFSIRSKKLLDEGIDALMFDLASKQSFKYIHQGEVVETDLDVYPITICLCNDNPKIETVAPFASEAIVDYNYISLDIPSWITDTDIKEAMDLLEDDKLVVRAQYILEQAIFRSRRPLRFSIW